MKVIDLAKGTVRWTIYGLEIPENVVEFEMTFSHEGDRRNYKITIRRPLAGELESVRLASRLLMVEIASDSFRTPDRELDADLYNHLRRTPWYLLLVLRLLSLRDVWINHPWYFEVSFGNVLGTYGNLRLDTALLARAQNLQAVLNRFYEAIWPIEAVRGGLQLAKQTRQSFEAILASAGLTREQYDQFAYAAWAMRRFMQGRNQHPDDYDETVLNLTSMLEQLYMRPREGDVTRKLSSRTARLVGGLIPLSEYAEIRTIVEHFYNERSVLMHRVYELPSKLLNVSSLSEISRQSLLAFFAFAVEGMSKTTVLDVLDAEQNQDLARNAKLFYGENQNALWAPEVELHMPGDDR